MKSIHHLFILIFAIIVSACRASSTGSTRLMDIQVPSLKESYSDLLLRAVEWDKDAYLYSASVYIDDHPGQRQISLAFHSPTKQYESIIITTLTDGSIEMAVVEHTIPVIQRSPILTHDWDIDSNEALTMFISSNEDAKEFLVTHPKHCSKLKLERFAPADNQPVVWTLSLFDCSYESKYFYLNPITGEMLPLSRSIMPSVTPDYPIP